MASYDFEQLPDRSDTGSIKWDRYRDRPILPMWVADMDFRSPPEVENALKERVAHGVYGYTNATNEAIDAVCQYMSATHGASGCRLNPSSLKSVKRDFLQAGGPVMSP